MPVNLSFTWMWCPKHLAPFRARWPTGAGLAMNNLFAASVADYRIIHAAQGDTNRLEPVLREHSPMCCFLPSEVTESVVQAALAGRRWPAPAGTETGRG